MEDKSSKKGKKRQSRKTVGGIKLPPIEAIKGDDIKTILDVDPDFYSLVQGRPIRPNKSIHTYKQNIKNLALKRTLNGFLADEIIRIQREMETENKIYETAYRHFEDCQRSFDTFLAFDNDKTIVIMKKSDTLAKDLANQTEEFRKVSYEMASLKSKLQYIDETLLILLSFENFLHKAAPILWQESNQVKLDEKHTEIINMESDIFRKIDKEVVVERLSRLPTPKLYFEAPEQLPRVFELLEKQNLNYLLVTEELTSHKNKFLKAKDRLRNLLNLELEEIQKKINEMQGMITWNDMREADLKEVFFKILEDKITYLVASDTALQIYNYVEFAYEKLISPNDTKINTLKMTQALEAEYDNLMLNLTVFDLDMIKKIEKETYEKGEKDLKQAEKANKLLKDVDKLSKRLRSSYEPSRKKKFD